MSPSEALAFYRLSAAHCIEIARHISDPSNKTSLFLMAQAWLALADHTEKFGKYGEITLVCETPSPRPEDESVFRPTRNMSLRVPVATSKKL